MTMAYTVAPLGPWLEPLTERRRPSYLFRASWSDTLVLLGRELGHLDAEQVVLQLDVAASRIRRDGMLAATAVVIFPGVRLSFSSRFGPLTYATDAYEHQGGGQKVLAGWQANIRAIALALEALRAVDRYGVTRRGEQYQGWTAIEQRPAEMTVDQAAEFIAHWAEPDAERREAAARALLRSPTLFLAQFYKRAARRAHPDVGGDHDTMARLNHARDLLTGAGR